MTGLHRNVIFKGDVVPPLPLSYAEAPFPEQLWTALEVQCARGDALLSLERHTRQDESEQVPQVVVGEKVDLEILRQCRQLGRQRRTNRSPARRIVGKRSGGREELDPGEGSQADRLIATCANLFW